MNGVYNLYYDYLIAKFYEAFRVLQTIKFDSENTLDSKLLIRINSKKNLDVKSYIVSIGVFTLETESCEYQQKITLPKNNEILDSVLKKFIQFISLNKKLRSVEHLSASSKLKNSPYFIFDNDIIVSIPNITNVDANDSEFLYLANKNDNKCEILDLELLNDIKKNQISKVKKIGIKPI